MWIEKFSTSGMIDERIPNAEIAEILKPFGIDPDVFCDWLAKKVGAYRFDQEHEKKAPSQSKEIDALNAIVRALNQAMAALDFEALPPIAEAHVNDYLWKLRGAAGFEVRQTLLDGVTLYRGVIQQVAHDLQKQPGRRGRKKASLRDALLAGVIAVLRESGLRAKAAREAAEEILCLCRVPVPQEVDSQRRATARGRQK